MTGKTISLSLLPAVAALVLSGACAEPQENQFSGSELESRVESCSTGQTTFGIDVSRYQGDINWQLLAGADVKFAYIQISRRIDDIDPKFEVNWAGAKSVGILRGAYQRFQPDQDVRGQADIFLDKLGPFEEGDLPPMLDVEDSGDLSAEIIAERVREWLTYVESELGVRPVIYTGRFFWRDTVNSADFTDYPLWIAHYTKGCPNIPSPWMDWKFHQYSSSAVLPGITENTVDVNHFNGSVDDLLALACVGDCEPCQTIGEGESVLDESGKCFRAGGNQEFIRSETEGYDSSLFWTHTTDAAEVGNFGLWNLHFAKAGRYLVEAHIPAPWGKSVNAAYLVEHAGEASAVTLNQGSSDGWTGLGEFSFAEGGDQFIRLNDNTGESNEGNTKLVFDAIRFTYLPGPDPVPPIEPGDSDKAGGGCQLAGQRGYLGGLWLLLVPLALLTRRKRCSRGTIR